MPFCCVTSWLSSLETSFIPSSSRRGLLWATNDNGMSATHERVKAGAEAPA
jgi:hypothetical protein